MIAVPQKKKKKKAKKKNNKQTNIQSNKQTNKQTKQKKTNDREMVRRKDKLLLFLLLHIFHTSFTFRHKYRFSRGGAGWLNELGRWIT